MMKDFAIILVIVFGSLGIGNYLADHATLKDCATKGIAHMAGGGSVKCDVVREASIEPAAQ